MKGYFAWQVSTSGSIRDKNPAPDGEEYFVTALFLASHRWGDGEGIFDYRAQANQILRDMYSNGETRYANGGAIEEFTLFDKTAKQIKSRIQPSIPHILRQKLIVDPVTQLIPLKIMAAARVQL